MKKIGVGLVLFVSCAAQAREFKEITQSLIVNNPGRSWHGEGLRLSIDGLIDVPKGCSSGLQMKVRYQFVREQPWGSSVSGYVYAAGKMGRAGFEAGIADGRAFVVQNGGQWKGSYSGGAIEGLVPREVRVTKTENGDTEVAVLDSASGDSLRATTRDDPDFVRGSSHRYTHLVLAIAYRNGEAARLAEGDSFLGWIDSSGKQLVSCGTRVTERAVRFKPLNRMSEVSGASQVYEISRLARGAQDGVVQNRLEYAVVVAKTETVREELLSLLHEELSRP